MPAPFPTPLSSYRRAGIGLIANQSQLRSTGSVFTCSNRLVRYTLAIVEFDDQGLIAGARKQMKALQAELDSCRAQGRTPSSWSSFMAGEHDGRLDDEDLTAFRAVLDQDPARQPPAAQGNRRPVLGVFGAWRGSRGTAPLSQNTPPSLEPQGSGDACRRSAPCRSLAGAGRAALSRGGEQPSRFWIIIGHSFGGFDASSTFGRGPVASSRRRLCAGRVVVVPIFREPGPAGESDSLRGRALPADPRADSRENGAEAVRCRSSPGLWQSHRPERLGTTWRSRFRSACSTPRARRIRSGPSRERPSVDPHDGPSSIG